MVFENSVITKLFDVMTIPIYGGISKQIQNRYAYGLTFCSTPTGKIIYELEGKEFVSDYSHALLLPMGRTYMLNGISTGEFPLINFFCDKPLNGNEFASFRLGSPNYYLSLYESIKEQLRHNRPHCYAKAMSLMYELISHLLADPDENTDGCLSLAAGFMDRNFSDPNLSMEQVARHAHISSGYLRKIFKEKYSIPPKKYILNARLMKSKEMLAGGDFLSIVDVALKCGFTNVYHFDRAFKDFTGCSPSEYIQRFSHKL